jgi:hypothetical protein
MSGSIIHQNKTVVDLDDIDVSKRDINLEASQKNYQVV